MAFNELLKEAGDFGLYQKFLSFGFLGFSITYVSFTFWTQIFILLAPPHKCRLTSNATWPSHFSWESNYSTYKEEKAMQCRMLAAFEDSGSTYRNNGSVSTSLAEISQVYALDSENSTLRSKACQHGWEYDFSLLYPTVTSEQNWVCESSWKMYVVHTGYWAGAIVGYVIFGFFSDRFGRRRSYQASVILTIVSDISSMFVSSHASFVASRFFAALGQGNISTVSFMISTEFTGPRKRVVVLFVWSVTWTIMSSIMPWIAYSAGYWRWMLAITFIPASLVLLMTYFIPESASWLVTRGRFDEAAQLIHRVATVNGKTLSMDYIKERLIAEKDRTEEKAKTEKGINNISSDCETKSTDKKNPSPPPMTFLQATVGLFKTPRMRKKTLILLACWMIACICYNGNCLQMSNLPFNVYLSFSIGALVELPANMFCILALDKLGRRWTSFGFFIIGGTLGIVSGCLPTGETLLILILAMVMRASYAAAFDIIFQFSSESFPTVVRGRGISVVRMFGGTGSALAPLVVFMSEYERLLPLIVFGGLALFAAGLILFISETAKQHLPHTLEEGEAFGKDQNFCFCPFSQKQDISTVITSRNINNDNLIRDERNGRSNAALEMKDEVDTRIERRS